MHLKHYPHNFNMMNTRSLALLPNPSESQVATLMYAHTMIPFYVFFQDNVSVYSPGCPGTILLQQVVHKLRDGPTCFSLSARTNGMYH